MSSIMLQCTIIRRFTLHKICQSKYRHVLPATSSCSHSRPSTVNAKRLLRHNFARSYSIESSVTFPSQRSKTGANNYEELCRTFKLDVPDYFNFCEDVLEKWAADDSKKQNQNSRYALWWTDENGNEKKWNYSMLVNEAKRMSNILEQFCTIEKGDSVIVILPRIPEWWILNIACLRSGAVICPGSTLLTPKDILLRLEGSKAKCIITDETTAKAVDKVAGDANYLQTKLLIGDTEKREGWISYSDVVSQVDDNHQCVKTKGTDRMALFFTSGTTGLPKMTEHTHISYGMGHNSTGRFWLDLTRDDVMWNMADTGWAKTAWSSIFGPWSQGACVFVHNSQKFEATTALDVLQRYPITVACIPPTAYRMIVQEDLSDYKFNHLRHCVSAGEPLNPEVVQTWHKATGLAIREGYGQTETALLCGTLPCMKVKPGSMGKPAPGFDLQIIDENGNPATDGNEGDLAIKIHPNRPIGLFTKYLDDDARTAATMRGDYYVTGDRGYKDDDGYFWFVGRSDDVIISAGYRIGPFEVENALLEHTYIVESAVVSSPDPIRGSIVKAFVVLSNLVPANVTTDALVKVLQTHVKETTAPYKYPRKIEFVEQLPKTISGKIRRVELRDQEWS